MNPIASYLTSLSSVISTHPHSNAIALIAYFWPSHWSIVKFLYLLTRFLPFVEIFAVIITQISSNSSAKQCQQRVSVATWLITAGFLIGEMLLALRTWAVLLRTRRSTVFLISTYIGVLVVPCCICLALFLKSLKFELQGVLSSSVVQGCFNTQESKIIVVAWVCFWRSILVCRIFFL
ncbi:hypothetical protein BDQ17DRAFT_545482 [Cyathus striatus]|nr:hypothetical protein BDQ17DRAFT_545482 [Cyathus striatus]